MPLSHHIVACAAVCTLTAATSVVLIGQSQGSSAVSGQVVLAGEHIPLKRARVVLQTNSGSLTVLTDANGNFAFSNVPADRYTLAASLPGYLPARDGNNSTQIQIGDSQVVRDIAIELARGAVLAGFVSDRTGAPIINGNVRISRESTAHEGRNHGVVTQTDDRGAFRIWGMPPGTFEVTASAASQANAKSEMRAILLKDGEDFENISISLPLSAAADRATKGGTISGTIYDDAGNPAAGARVEALGPNGVTSLAEGATVRATDRGEYRLWGLPPGQYYLRATPMISTSVNGVGAADQSVIGRVAYIQTFYPGTESLNRAEPIALREEEEMTGIGFALRLTSIATIKGVVHDRNGTSVQNAMVTIAERAPSPERPVTSFTTRSNPFGVFELDSVPSGQYTIETFADGAQPKYASDPLVVTGSAIPDLSLVLRDGVTISGRISWDSDSGPRFNPEKTTISVRRVSAALSGRLTNTRVLASGNFTFTGILPGKYLLRASNVPAGWFLRSIKMGNMEVAGSLIEVPSSGLLEDVRLVFAETHP
jgi:hypothetical protein